MPRRPNLVMCPVGFSDFASLKRSVPPKDCVFSKQTNKRMSSSFSDVVKSQSGSTVVRSLAWRAPYLFLSGNLHKDNRLLINLLVGSRMRYGLSLLIRSTIGLLRR